MMNVLRYSAAYLFLTLFLGGISVAHGQANSSYRLGVGDTIKILVFEEPDMSFDVTIDNTGLFAYPYLNEVTLLGKTTGELERELVKGLKGRVLVNPNISISVVEYRAFSIGGEVKNPGNYPFEPNLTVKKAINLAGGVTEWSNGKRFKVEREKPIEDERFSLDTPIYPGDILTVLPRRF